MTRLQLHPEEGKNPSEKQGDVVCQQHDQSPAHKGDRNCCQRRCQADDVLVPHTSKAGHLMHGTDLGKSNHVPERIRLRAA